MTAMIGRLRREMAAWLGMRALAQQAAGLRSRLVDLELQVGQLSEDLKDMSSRLKEWETQAPEGQPWE